MYRRRVYRHDLNDIPSSEPCGCFWKNVFYPFLAERKEIVAKDKEGPYQKRSLLLIFTVNVLELVAANHKLFKIRTIKE